MESFWDLRYSEPGFVYGTEPNAFFRETIRALKPGKLLLPGEGEGRNAVYAAGLGWSVDAFDQSSVARKKALEWAQSKGLEIRYTQADMKRFACPEREYDLVALVFVHMSPDLRRTVHRRLAGCLKPGGMILLECFHKDQLKFGTGGPGSEEMLCLEDDLLEDFRELEVLRCEHEVVDIREGKYHTGKSAVIRLIATNISR